MTRRQLMYLLIYIMMFSCNFSEKKGEKTTLKINLEFRKDDKIQLFYTEHPLDNFVEKKSKTLNIKGQDGIQELIFNFPEEIHPLKIRIDLGDNQSQNIIKIQTIVISKDDEFIRINSDNFSKYLLPNDYVVHIESSSDFKLDAKKENYDPYLLSTSLLIKELIEL
ncbi:hypothetical protein [Croceitalea sp. P059]|uniref:hypothetical protein n=1 Tax=Croceitalea sp. P059 TaxID=3075601 RepID=UPI0028883EA6|nr:hypothetical protein [Croceitalea sp. P059]MDT0538720.1 hypothetical protein [Croceitalea sp. P059]